MKALFDFLENTLTPIAGRLATQKHVCAIRDGFIGAMPFMIVGSFLLVFAFPPFTEDTTFAIGKLWVGLSSSYFDEIMTPFNMSMGIMSCYISACIAYNLAQSYKLDAMPTAMLSLMSFLLVAAPMKDGALSAAYLGGTGIFTAILVAIFVTELTRFLKVKNIGFRMPEQVPDKIRQSFNLLIPAMIVIVTIYTELGDSEQLRHATAGCDYGSVPAFGFSIRYIASYLISGVGGSHIVVCRYPWFCHCQWHHGAILALQPWAKPRSISGRYSTTSCFHRTFLDLLYRSWWFRCNLCSGSTLLEE
ncbi:PTS systemcellobiose-specific IIC component [Vibrio maritimus]|uniref:PTS systemcellobiose-specific IIC component n=1 Tax=Vibrio maritimus TaxID=990268 RepID=A0A090SW91_9VIBR|nr:PTS systemcellobiose-specific IIC component [Vibrio maritimus]